MASSIAVLTRQKIVPKPHQVATVEFLLSWKRAYNLSACGSGKTFPSVESIRLLYDYGAVPRILVVAPLSVIRATWVEHMESFAPGVPLMLLDVARKRKKQAAELASFNGVAIINPDGLASMFHELRTWCPGLVVIDELSGYYRNSQTNRWKALNMLMNLCKPGRWAFTGTPLTKNILDSYAQCLLINPDNLPRRRDGRVVSFKAYRDMLCNQPYPNVWVPKKDALERVHSFMQPAVRYTREQVMGDIKEPIRLRKDIPLTPEQQKLLKDMIDAGKAQYAGQQINAKEAQTLITKLVQITTGSVYDNKGVEVEVPCGPRIQALVDLHEEVEYSPVIVAVPFIHTIHRLKRDLSAKGYRVEYIIGAVSPNARGEIIARLQAGQIDFLLCQPKTLAHGVTLTRSSTVCWFGPIYDLELYAQLNDRIFRYGQEGQPLVVEFCSTPTEAHVYASLRGKEKLSGIFLKLFGG